MWVVRRNFHNWSWMCVCVSFCHSIGKLWYGVGSREYCLISMPHVSLWLKTQTCMNEAGVVRFDAGVVWLVAGLFGLPRSLLPELKNCVQLEGKRRERINQMKCWYLLWQVPGAVNHTSQTLGYYTYQMHWISPVKPKVILSTRWSESQLSNPRLL